MTTTLIRKACDNLGLSYRSMDEFGVFLRIELGNEKFHLCIASNLGLNDEVVEKISRDKAYTHDLLSDFLTMPKSVSYIDPEYEFQSDIPRLNSYQEIVSDIMAKNQLPVVLKPNSKLMGINVFLCQNLEDIQNAVSEIFNKKSYQYDHILLVQEQIKIKKEYRVVVYNGTIQFVYQKDNTGPDAEFAGNLSPLHFSNARAIVLDEVTDAQMMSKLADFIFPIYSQINLIYAGLDIALDEAGELYLIEINTRPGFNYFIKDNGEELVIKMLEKIIGDLR